MSQEEQDAQFVRILSSLRDAKRRLVALEEKANWYAEILRGVARALSSGTMPAGTWEPAMNAERIRELLEEIVECRETVARSRSRLKDAGFEVA